MKLRISNGRSGFKQWDANQRLLCYGVTTGTQIHFALNSERALVVEAYEADGQIVADVPNILLQYAAPIRAYVYVQEDPEKYTKYDVTFPVQARPKPDDYIYEETEVLSIESVVNNVLAESDFLTEADRDDILAETEWKVLADVTLDETQAAVSTIKLELPNWEVLRTATRMRFEAEIKPGETAIASQLFQIKIADINVGVYEIYLCRVSSCGAIAVGQAAYSSGRFEIGPYEYTDQFGSKSRRFSGWLHLPAVYHGANSIDVMRRLNDFIRLSNFEQRPPYLHISFGGGGVFGAGTRVRLEVC